MRSYQMTDEEREQRLRELRERRSSLQRPPDEPVCVAGRGLFIGILIVLVLTVAHCAHAEPLALIFTPTTTCVDGGSRNACSAGKLDIPQASDLVTLCPTPANCWAEASPKVQRFADVPSDASIDGCVNQATARGAQLPVPWSNALDPCGSANWKSSKKSAFAAAPVNTTGIFDITWTAPTVRVDGTPLNDLAGFWIWSAAKGSALGKLKQIPSGTTLAVSLPAFGNGEYQFAVSAYDASGGEGPISPTVDGKVQLPPNAPPGAPLDVQVIFRVGAQR